MTNALCLLCGDIKFGALVPCPKCQALAVSDMQLNITFSDHHIALSTMEQMGEVIRVISAATPSPQIRFWTFLYYVSTNHPGLLRIDLEGEAATSVPALLESLTLPPVEFKPGRQGIERPKTAGENSRKWWQFWKRGP